MMREVIQKLVEGKDLTEHESIQAMTCIMDGNATPAQIGSFITALRMKGETIQEITGCARVMRQKANKIEPELDYYIDTCGTGGDGANTFNISTASAFVCAAAGVPVAKHGNRSVSSKSGSADVLEALGVNILLSAEQVKKCIEQVGIGFLFALSFHQSMKYAGGPRKELGIRTIFNVLGPLTNPANAKGQVLGVFDGKLTEPIANVLMNLGTERAMVVHGLDGMDEITTTALTEVSEIREGKVVNYKIDPLELGIKKVSSHELTGGDSKRNTEIIKGIFSGAKGPGRDIVILNSAAAIYIGKKAKDLEEGLRLAASVIDSGKALEKLNEFIKFTNEIGLASCCS